MGVKVEVVLSLETTFSVGVGGWLAGENGTKAISTQDQMKLKLKFELSLAIKNFEAHFHRKLRTLRTYTVIWC